MKKNEPVAGVSIKISALREVLPVPVKVTSCLRSRLEKNIPSNSAVGYEKKTVDEIEVAEGKVTELNIVLSVSSKNLGAVTVTANRTNARRETAASMISFQKNTNTVASVISAETIRRSPDKNTGEVLKRTPGASIQEGRFIIVRGLADRYNQAMLNGILSPVRSPIVKHSLLI